MNKQQQLIELLKSYQSVAVAFSGGVDSSVLAKATQIALGDKSIAITAVSELITTNEISDAKKVAKLIGIKHELFTVDDLADKKFTCNDKMRCYHCHINTYYLLTYCSSATCNNTCLSNSFAILITKHTFSIYIILF